MVNGIELTVASALVTDDGRGIARMDSKARKLLNVVSGDVIEIKGKRKSTAAIVMAAHPQDEGLDFVRIDGWIRQNIGRGDRRQGIRDKGGSKERGEGHTGAAAEPEDPDIARFRMNTLRTSLRTSRLSRGM